MRDSCNLLIFSLMLIATYTSSINAPSPNTCLTSTSFTSFSTSPSSSTCTEEDYEKQSDDLLINDLDDDHNGVITFAEVTQYVKETGGKGLDEEKEISTAAKSMFNKLDLNHDHVVKTEDLPKFFASLSHLLSVNETYEWAMYSVFLPESKARKVLENSISGYDFRHLLANDDALREAFSLNDNNLTERRYFSLLQERMKMRLFGMALPPNDIESFSCSIRFSHVAKFGIDLTWEGHNSFGEDGRYPVHAYRIDRFDEHKNEWKTIFSGLGHYHEIDIINWDQVLPSLEHPATTTLQYRLSAWNIIGRSHYSYVYCPAPIMPEIPLGYIEQDNQSSIDHVLPSQLILASDAVTVAAGTLLMLFAIVSLVKRFCSVKAATPVMSLVPLAADDQSSEEKVNEQPQPKVKQQAQRIQPIVPIHERIPPIQQPQQVVRTSSGQSTPGSNTPVPQPDQPRRDRSNGSDKFCYQCGRDVFVWKLTSYKKIKHICCKCKKTYCTSCLATVDHNRFLACPVGSCCTCKMCFQQFD